MFLRCYLLISSGKPSEKTISLQTPPCAYASLPEFTVFSSLNIFQLKVIHGL